MSLSSVLANTGTVIASFSEYLEVAVAVGLALVIMPFLIRLVAGLRRKGGE